MKCNKLLLALLTVFGSATLAMDKPVNQTPESKKQVDPEDVCPVCLKLAKDFSPDKIRITDCCKQFICWQDASNTFFERNQRIRQKEDIKRQLRSTEQQLGYHGLDLTAEQFKQMYKIAKQSIFYKTKRCPSCPQKKWSISDASVKTPLASKPVLTFIDSENNQFELSPELSAALYQCASLEMADDKLTTNTEPLDYSDVKPEQKRFIKKDLIIKLAQLIKDPVNETQNMVQNTELFELANFLLAPNNILYLISNELWPLMQDKTEDNDAIKAHKKTIRGLAQPHLASVKQLIEYKKFHRKGYNVCCMGNYSNSDQSAQINLSWTHISGQLEDAGWYQDAKHTWYKVYPFCKWDDIQSLWWSSSSYAQYKPDVLDVTGHRLETVSENLLKMMHSTHDLNITLDHNPINSIDESFFKKAAQERATGKSINISLIHNHLSDKQKEEFTQKWHDATTTFVQKYMGESTYKYLAKGAGCLGSALAIGYLSHKAHDRVQEFSVLSTLIGGAIAGYKIADMGAHPRTYDPRPALFGGLIGAIAAPVSFCALLDRYPKIFALPAHLMSMQIGAFITKKISDYAVIKLAKQSHPEISWAANADAAWNTNYQLKF